MAELALTFDNAVEVSGQMLRQGFEITQEGIVAPGDLAVTPGVAANTVDVAIGTAYVQGDGLSDLGRYRARNDAVKNSANFALGGITAPHATNPRLDQIVARVYDHDVDASGQRKWQFEVLTGTPTPGATLANRSGVAVLPNSACRLADVLIAAGAPAVIPAANIGNPKNHRIGQGGYPAGSLSSVAGAPPQFAFGRPAAYTPQLRAGKSGLGTSVVNNTWVAVPFDTADFDTDVMHDLVTNNTRVTCKTPGFYEIKGVIGWASNPDTAKRGARLLLNGATAIEQDDRPNAGADLFQTVATRYYLGYGDYIELQGLQLSGGTFATAFAAGSHLVAGWSGP